MKHIEKTVTLGFAVWLLFSGIAQGQDPTIVIPATEDFTVSGGGEAAAWEKAEWVSLVPWGEANHDYETRFKMLYSETGLYVLFDGSDSVLSASRDADFLDLYNEDVYEFFFWTDERYPIYFEYEISPLGYELPIIVPNFDGTFFGWRPWQYEGDRLTQKATAIVGGAKTSGASIEGWRAEIYVPYDLLKPLSNVPPQSGTRWRANFYRIDYDDDQVTYWNWAAIEVNFHDFALYGTIVFE